MAEKNKKESLYCNLYVKKVPRQMLWQYKAYCALNGITLGKGLISLIRQKLKEVGRIES